MKIIAIILSIYVFALTAIPCVDVQNNISVKKVEVSQQGDDAHHHNDSDNCSPFCTCNCCATSVIFQEHPNQISCYSFFEKQYSPVTPDSFSDLSVSIWQPPKIV